MVALKFVTQLSVKIVLVNTNWPNQKVRFLIQRTFSKDWSHFKNKDGCESGRKVEPQDSKSDMPLV